MIWCIIHLSSFASTRGTSCIVLRISPAIFRYFSMISSCLAHSSLTRASMRSSPRGMVELPISLNSAAKTATATKLSSFFNVP